MNRPRLLAATFGLSLLGVAGLASIAGLITDAEARKPRPGPSAKLNAPAPAPEPKDTPQPQPPLVEATATVWAAAGSRSWTGCAKIATEAAKQLFGHGEATNSFRENHHWAIQARECPNAPEVLAMAARAELLRRFDLPEGLDDQTDLTALELGLSESRARATAWIDGALLELRRRRDKRDLGLEYWRGRALLSLNEIEGANEALAHALANAATEGWKLRRLQALATLYAGDLDAALIQAKRANIDAPISDRIVSLYVLALVLDRAGDTAGAERRMIFALDMDGDGFQMRALESALPIHERLYLRAYAKTVRRETAGGLRLWDAYFARPEPEQPERRLAERHRSALQPLPTSLGGPPRPEEGRAAGGGSKFGDAKAPN